MSYHQHTIDATARNHAEIPLLQRYQDICQWLLGRHTQRSRPIDEHTKETAKADGHDCVGGKSYYSLMSF